ncbi:hypothetical protein AB0395_35790 [Streptosporangium sp. NPDC051023]|uniref:hypothetical protein n=1 Tax=Streptosporangium sp. NPDC051023 TaxID=3155410 RepID=UPI0034500E3D
MLFYRAFDRLTSLLDPARHDRRACLPQHEADRLATAWEDDDLEHHRRRDLLQEIVTALVPTPVRWAKGRGCLANFQGDMGLDTTAVPVFARPPRVRRSTGEETASTEITTSWHYSAEQGTPEFGYSATLTVAARTRTTCGPFPQLALGFKLALDYRVNQRGVQGSVHGALLIGHLSRFDRLRQREPSRPAVVDLADTRQRAAHPSAKSRILPPAPDNRPGELPKTCRSSPSPCTPTISDTRTSSARTFPT